MTHVYSSKPLIFDIHHFTLDDGPGIRTTVFLKGCPLSCLWCQNPESMDREGEIAFYANRCIDCGDCRKVCPEDAIRQDHQERIDRRRCTLCGECARECPTNAIKMIGEFYSIHDLVDILMSDHIFYETSKGGVTFSGGEPTLYMDHVSETIKELKKNSVHIAVQTCGMFDLSEFKTKLLPLLDLIFYDIKLFDPEKHKKYTGKSNKQILNNFVELLKEPDIKMIPRVPLIPGITATSDNLLNISHFLKNAGCTTYQLLPYNPGGISKRITLGKRVPEGLPCSMMAVEEEKEWGKIFLKT